MWPDFDSLDPSRLLWCGEVRSPEWTQESTLEDQARLVRDAIASALTEKQREVVEAHFFEGRSEGQIAAELGITQQVVHKRLYGVVRDGHRIGGALRRLRAALAPHFDR